MQRSTAILVSAFILGSILPSALSQESSLAARRSELKTAIAAEWEYQLKTHPEFATYVGDTRFNDRMSDYSAAAQLADVRHSEQALKRFQAIHSDGFTEEEKLNLSLMIQGLQDGVAWAAFKPWEMPVDQMNGIHLDLAAIPSQVPLETVKDYQNYLSRLHQIPQVLEQTTENMRAGLADHLMPPKYLLEKVVVQTDGIAHTTPEKSPFYQPCKKFNANISAEEQQQLSSGILKAITDEVLPAYARFAEFVRKDYAPKGRTEFGVWALPNGDARYRIAVRQNTTTNFSPEEIHQMGLKQVKEIEEQMLVIAKEQGFSDLDSFNEHIRKDPKHYGTSGQQIFDLYKQYTDQMYAKLPQLFGHLPKNKLEVVPMEEYRAPAAVPADYSPGAGNGGRPGRINVNEYAPERRLLLNVEAIAYHEGIPGHHMQFSISEELTDLPPFRKYANYNAYSEGWAFYAERLGKEVGFYQDPYSEYGRLENEMWRSVRLVVDTGVHYKHWSRQQMVDFFHAHTAMDDPNIQSEVDRYIAWPGQALAYKLGQMKILELRERARQELGSKFDIRSFHDAVLSEGPLPLDIFEQHMLRWMDEQKKLGVN
jgi:uncharacterized protein (DUF885 family)